MFLYKNKVQFQCRILERLFLGIRHSPLRQFVSECTLFNNSLVSRAVTGMPKTSEPGANRWLRNKHSFGTPTKPINIPVCFSQDPPDHPPFFFCGRITHYGFMNSRAGLPDPSTVVERSVFPPFFPRGLVPLPPMPFATTRVYWPAPYSSKPAGWIIGWNKKGLTVVVASISRAEVCLCL